MKRPAIAFALLASIAARSGAQNSASSTIVAGEMGRRADSVMTAAERAGFSGAVRLSMGGATVLEKGYGLADRSAGLPFTPQTLVQIGSNTKDFTAVAILQLQEQGQLRLSDSIGKFFPEWPADKRGVTIKQVLEHRAGLPNFVGTGGDFEPIDRDAFLTALMKAPLLSVPGTAQRYSNAGYSLLAAIIEKLSGTSYDSYVNDHILAPVGMHHTGFALWSYDPRLLAHGYRGDTDIGTILGHPHPADGPYWNLRGNGGMSSTLDDMHAFYQALFTTSILLQPATRALRFDANAPIALAGSDGVSFFLYQRFPVAGVEMIIASNHSITPVPAVSNAVLKSIGLAVDDDASAPRATLGAAPPAVAALLRSFVDVINSGDSARIRSFVADNFAGTPGSPDANTRTAQLVKVHTNLGAIVISAIGQVSPGVMQVVGKAANGDRVTFRIEIDDSTGVPRIKSIGLSAVSS